jgi:hypothetical protein
MVRYYSHYHSEDTIFWISQIVNSSDSALRASSFALRATTGQDDGTRRMGSILPCCLPYGKAGGLQILCCQGINVTDYNFNLDALALKPSDFCNFRVKD